MINYYVYLIIHNSKNTLLKFRINLYILSI
uniref:Uncharacterized protein n=1 Tax=Siphoviridae sp. ctiOl67 TaxID=2825622 RepID=A0A8S5QJI0_9CAUD|nr:MAG TPA: hypothetical protein [Siphoviridae sp. ctiOl67]